MKKVKVMKPKTLSPEEIRKRNEQKELEKKRKEQRSTANLERLKEKDKIEEEASEKTKKMELDKKENEKVLKDKIEKEKKIRNEIERLRAKDKQRRLSDKMVKENLECIKKVYLERIKKMREKFTKEMETECAEDIENVRIAKRRYEEMSKQEGISQDALDKASRVYTRYRHVLDEYEEELRGKIEVEEMRINSELAEEVRAVTQKAQEGYQTETESEVESLTGILGDRDSEVEEIDDTMVEREMTDTEDSDYEGIRYMKEKLRNIEKVFLQNKAGPSSKLTEMEVGSEQIQEADKDFLNKQEEIKEYDLYIEDILNIQEEIFEITSSKDCKKEIGRNIRREIRKLLNVVLKQHKALIYYKAKYEEVTKKVEESKKISYADKVKEGGIKVVESARSRSRSRSRHMVTVYPVKDGTSENTKKEMSGKMDIKDLEGGVIGIRKIQKGGILVEVENKEDVDKFIKSVEKNIDLKENYVVRKTSKRQPQIIIFNLDFEGEEKELKEELVRRNDLVKEEEDIKVRGKYKGRYGNNWILDVRPEIFKELMKLKKIRVGWQSYSIKENLRPMLCYACARPGHLAKNCKCGKICVKCGDKDHSKEDCNNERRCVNCKYVNETFKAKFDLNHDCFDKTCPFYMKEVNKLSERTDYGD